MKAAEIILFTIIVIVPPSIGGLGSKRIDYNTITTPAPQEGYRDYMHLMTRLTLYLQSKSEDAPKMRVTINSVHNNMPHAINKFQEMFIRNWGNGKRPEEPEIVYAILKQSIDEIFNTIKGRVEKHHETVNELLFICSLQQAIPFLAHISGKSIQLQKQIAQKAKELNIDFEAAEIMVLDDDFLVKNAHSVMAEMIAQLSAQGIHRFHTD